MLVRIIHKTMQKFIPAVEANYTPADLDFTRFYNNDTHTRDGRVWTIR